MKKLLTHSPLAEEESKRKMQEKSNVAKQKKQKKKAKKKGAPATARAEEASAEDTDKHNDVEADSPGDAAAGNNSIVDALGQTRTLRKTGKADISDHVLGRLHGGQDYRQSAF